MTATPHTRNRIRLVDAAEQPGRTTASLLASLAARLGSLYLISGADAVGSIAAGLAALGREAGRSAEGDRLRRALLAGRAGVNGDRLWSALRIAEWLSAMPPSPVLDQLRNDVALLLTGDLDETLELMPIPSEMAGVRGSGEPEPVVFVDYVLGLWAFSRELVGAVDLLAAPTLQAPGAVSPPEQPREAEGSLLR